MISVNTVAFLNGFVMSDLSCSHTTSPVVMSLCAELMQRGYMLSENAMKSMHDKQAITFYNELLPFIDDMMGNGNYKPLYAGFPQQVMSMSHLELWINQIVHYISNGTFIPDNSITNRGVAFEHTTYKVIDVKPADAIFEVFTSLTSDRKSVV